MADRADDGPERPVSEETPLLVPRGVTEIPRPMDTAVARGS